MGHLTDSHRGMPRERNALRMDAPAVPSPPIAAANPPLTAEDAVDPITPRLRNPSAMQLTLVSGEASRAAASLLVLPIFDAEVKNPGATLGAVAEALGPTFLEAAAEEGFKGGADQSFVFHTHGALPASRVVLVGLGKQDAFEDEILRRAAGRAAKIAQRVKASSAVVALPSGVESAAAVRAAAEGVLLGAYRFDRYKSPSKNDKKVELAKVSLVLADDEKKSAATTAALDLAEAVAAGTNFARDLVNEPAGVMNPKALADAISKAGKKAGLSITVGNRRQIEAQKMGMFLAVARASTEEPQLIHVVYKPKNAEHAKRPPLALVGKAITFDSGGLSLKPSDAMLDMKIDMAGSGAVFGAMLAIAKIAPPFPVHAFVGACENMIGGNAYKLGDVLVSRAGKTVEVTNTDAEGRLVLGDILHWAAEHEPFQLVDLATLTGACMVALGRDHVGVFSPSDEVADDVLGAFRSAGEFGWRLPLHPYLKETLKSDIADMRNAGDRYGGASSAAMFLKEFVGETPWAHLDIAGPASYNRERNYQGKGATGVGVRTLIELVRKHAENPPAPRTSSKAPRAAKARSPRRAAAKKSA